MNPSLCPFCRPVIRSFVARNPHADVKRLVRDRMDGCCRYWLARGIPNGWWM